MADLLRVGSLGRGGVRGAVKQVKVEKPRPLKIGGGAHPELSLDDLLVVIEGLRKSLGVKGEVGKEHMVGQLRLLLANLRINGPTLERSHKDQMDKLNNSLMLACRIDSLNLVARVHMLELIELRTMGWQPSENVTNYYKQKLAQIECELNPSSIKAKTAPVTLNPNASDFNPFKISFESKLSTHQSRRTPKELKTDSCKGGENKPGSLVVTSTGDSQTNLPELPILTKSKDLECGVKVQRDEVKNAKIGAFENFNICTTQDAIMESPPPELDEKHGDGACRKNTSRGSSKSKDSDIGTIDLVKPQISYDKQKLVAFAKSPLCKVTPSILTEVTKDIPGLIRRADRAGPTSKIIQREMEGLRKQEEAKNM